MSALQTINPNAERSIDALAINLSAAQGLMGVMKSNLGPRGTMKLLVSGGGDLKLTKDGNTLLQEMQIQHPTAALIARAASAQDEITGDGTTSCVLLIGELLRQSERYLADGVHPRVLVQGFDFARKIANETLDSLKVPLENPLDPELLRSVARCSLTTKVEPDLAGKLAEMVVDAVLCVRREGRPIDLFMVETMTMKHKSALSTQLVKGLVLDHGVRHPDMPRELHDCFVLTCNASLEYEKPELNATVTYSTAAERDALVQAEHARVDDDCRRIIALKRAVCTGSQSFVIINQKGIDPLALDALAREGIMALRRAKRRNMERLVLACGGLQVNSFDDLAPEVLGHAGHVHEHALGDERYTFVEGVANAFSCTLLVRGAFEHQVAQTRDALRDGLRAVKNAVEDRCVVPGGGAFEVAAHAELDRRKGEVEGGAKFGVAVFAEAMLGVPKTLGENAGFDTQESVVALLDERRRSGKAVGLDLETGRPMDPAVEGVWDNYRVKRQMLHSSVVIASQLLLVDELIKAGPQVAQAQPGQE